MLFLIDGAPARIRTADLLITNQLYKFKKTIVYNNYQALFLTWQQSCNNVMYSLNA